jgi:hypothetical protein
MRIRWQHLLVACCLAAAPIAVSTAPESSQTPSREFLNGYCVTCHNQRAKTAGLTFDTLDVANVAADAATWEKAVVKLRAGLMPPAGARRPPQAVIDGFVVSLEAALDRADKAHPNPGRTEPFHRLNRAEYQNAVRDLLSLDIDADALLPADEVSYGFDNIAGVLKLSPLLTERYLNAAQKVARLALGTPAPPNGDLYRIPDQLDQDVRLDGMPPGTRGGIRIDYFVPRDGEYDIKARIGRGIDYDIPHFIGEQNLEISVDGARVHMFTLPATPDEDLNIERQVFRTPGTARPRNIRVDANGDAIPDEAALKRRTLDDNWVIRIPLKAGTHEIRATFLMKSDAVSEGFRKPFLKPYIGRGPTDARETREGASLRSLEIMGPLNPGSPEESQSHKRVFVCHPPKAADEASCATTILTKLARRAYRRPVNEGDLKTLLAFYREGRASGTFDTGVELALQRILVSPSFLFRTEFAPVTVAASESYRISDLDLASRLSFFSGAAFQTMSCWIWRCRESCTSRPCSIVRPGGCSPIRVRRPSPRTSPDSGCHSAGCRTSSPIRFYSPTTATRWRSPFRERASSSSTASSARIGRRRICWTPTTPSSTSGSPSTTAFRT